MSYTPHIIPTSQVPPVVLYKIEAQNKPVTNTFSQKEVLVKEAEEKTVATTKPLVQETVAPPVQIAIVLDKPSNKEDKIIIEKKVDVSESSEVQPVAERKETVEVEELKEDSHSRRDKKKHKVKRKEYEDDYYYEYRESKRESKRSPERRSVKRKEKSYDKDRERDRRQKKSRELVENEIISIEENDEEFIDLTGELSDAKGNLNSNISCLLLG